MCMELSRVKRLLGFFFLFLAFVLPVTVVNVGLFPPFLYLFAIVTLNPFLLIYLFLALIPVTIFLWFVGFYSLRKSGLPESQALKYLFISIGITFVCTFFAEPLMGVFVQ